jgi:hypothetical protein
MRRILPRAAYYWTVSNEPDDFYEGPPLEDSDRWHEGSVVEPREEAGDDLPAEQVTRDPSLSRAVDRQAAGLEPEAEGYDRSIEGSPPGPLAPPANETVDADDETSGGGQYSGS